MGCLLQFLEMRQKSWIYFPKISANILKVQRIKNNALNQICMRSLKRAIWSFWIRFRAKLSMQSTNSKKISLPLMNLKWADNWIKLIISSLIYRDFSTWYSSWYLCKNKYFFRNMNQSSRSYQKSETSPFIRCSCWECWWFTGLTEWKYRRIWVERC